MRILLGIGGAGLLIILIRNLMGEAFEWFWFFIAIGIGAVIGLVVRIKFSASAGLAVAIPCSLATFLVGVWQFREQTMEIADYVFYAGIILVAVSFGLIYERTRH